MKQRYDPHPSVAMVRSWTESLKQKTGRTLDEWIKLLKSKGPESTKERIAWLKSEHKLNSMGAMWVAEHASDEAEITGDDKTYLKRASQWVDRMFSGPKAALRPLYDRLYDLARSLGDDVRVSPATTIVPIYRNHVIAQIKPSTNKRIDFGLALGNMPAKGRLIDTGGYAKKDRITHRIEIASMDDIDGFVEQWLRTAYDADA